MYQCTYCGSLADPVHGCPACGRPAPPLAAEIERLDRDISDMTSRDLAIQRERANLSAKMQAALHQRALLQGAQSQRVRRAPRQRRGTARRVATLLPTTLPGRRVGTLLPDETPMRGRGTDGRRAGDLPPRGGRPAEPAPPTVPAEGLRPEASSRSVQNVLLGLGAMLLAIAAAIFAAYFVTSFDPIGRVAILVVSSAIVLMTPPLVGARGLTSTAEWITTVGLILVPLIGYALWGVAGVRTAVGLTPAMFAGAVGLGTAALAWAYHLATGLTAPRYAALLAVQPAAPLLAYDVVRGATGWALVFAAVAAADMAIAGWMARERRNPRDRVARLASAGWLRESTWILHGLAVGAALTYATVGLGTAGDLPMAAAAAGALLLSAAIGLAGALSLRHHPLPDLAAGVMTLAVIGSAGRVAAVALPGRALVLIAGAVAVTGAGVRVLPVAARRGPQLAASGTLAVLGLVVAGLAVRAGIAPVRAALPPWHPDLSRYAQLLADAVGPARWQVAVSAALLTVAAWLAVPAAFRREAAVVGTALTALAVPAGFRLGWTAVPWVLVAGSVLVGVTGFTAPTLRSARTHVVAALVVGLAGAATSLAERELTAGVLTALTVAGLVLGFAPRYVTAGPYADVIAAWAQGGAAAALPGAVATTTASVLPTPQAVPVLAASLLAVAGALGYAAIAQVALQRPNMPVALGGTFGALAVAVAAFAADGATVADALVATVLLIGALLLWFAPSIDAGRRADRWVDGADVAAAAVTAGAIGALVRATALVLPRGGLATTAALILAVVLGVRAMPVHWRPGPVLGSSLAGASILIVAGYSAALGGLRVLIEASPVWDTSLADWPARVAIAQGYGWQTPVTLLLLAAAAAAVLPLKSRSVVVPACVALAVAGAPAGLALPWWSPVALGLGVGTILAMAAVATATPRLGIGRASAGAALVGYAVGASLVQPWATASALAGVAVAGLAVATAARRAAPLPADPVAPASTQDSSHLLPVGGAAVTAALLALPGAVAAAAASLDRDTGMLTAALAASSIGLALTALLRRPSGPYLTYAATGTAASATFVAFAALITGEPFGVYAAAAALLGVLSELLRSGTRPPAARARVRLRLRRTAVGLAFDRANRRAPGDGAGVLTPGLLATAAVPTGLALASIGPALFSVLAEPQATLRNIWQGPAAAGVDWTGAASGPSVLAALVLTLAAALAAAGFGGRAEARLSRDELIGQVVPVLLPGIAITLLIAPAGLGAGWPAGTVAALAVFTIAMLGVALSPPPPDSESARPLRATRWIVLAIGLAAGSAGLAGSLATRSLTLGTLAGAVGVGLTAALRGRTGTARVLGWAFAAASAHLLAYVAGLALGLPGPWSAFGVLTVATLTIVTAVTLSRLNQPGARGEGAALEWSGYAGALLSLVLAASSLPHLAALLAAAGAILGVVAVRPSRGTRQRRALLWSAVGCELIAWWLLMRIATVALPEAYTLAFAALALAVGIVELRHHPEVGSWAAYGPALVAAFVPTLAIVLVTDADATRRIVLLLAAVGTLIAGSVRRQRAPVVVGGVVTTIAALHELFQVSDWLIFIPIGILLIVLGGQYEKRRRDLQRLRGALTRMR